MISSILFSIVVVIIGIAIAKTIDKDNYLENNVIRDCKLHGHLFHPRYSIEPTLNKYQIPSNWTLEDVRSAVDITSNKTYIHDICIYCGLKS